ncbi:glycosyltransferase family 4 protein [Chimaeribacter arupi]|uniref:glycosyltransferase family 4 protein n=1 Tax=Chimaeribacter arupi TaxID=2060066 RepID=UPI000C79971B|nr:glycosyltransferase family 4 protein [Chimaeribacter arupi]PLR29782.1 glycosyltransferase family 1 protein [Chimaeribacter arupi]
MKKLCYFINSDWYFDLHWLTRAIGSQSEGYQIHIICHFLDDNILKKFTDLGFICHNSSMSSQSMNPILFINSLVKISGILKIINPDILHCITIKPCLIGGFYSRFFNKNIIISFVGLGRIFNGEEWKLRFLRKLIVPFYKFVFKNSKCLLSFEHEDDREKLISLTGVTPEKTIVIDGAGIDTEIYAFSQEINNSIPIVLFASRLLKSKGLGDLIQVKKKLAAKGIRFQLNVAGIPVPDDADAISLSTIQHWHDAGDINWLGKRGDIDKLIREANIVALPSTYSEGVPRILLEAASVGRPIIAYDVGGCNSLIKNNMNGYLIKKGDIDSLAEKLSLLLLQPESRKAMGTRSRSIIEERFSSTLVLKKTLEMYHRSLNRGY